MNSKLEIYTRWFDDLSFFRHNTFVLDNIDILYSIINAFGAYLCDFSNNKIEYNYTKVSRKENISLVQTFFDIHNINYNINEMVDNGIIEFKELDKETQDISYGNRKDGYISKKDNKIFIFETNTIQDSIVLVHELLHFYNEPKEKRNFNSDMLTEAISYAIELIFIEDILKEKYSSDYNLHYKVTEKTMYNYCYNMFPIYQLVLVFAKEKGLDKESFSKQFDSIEYERTMKDFEMYISNKGDIVRDTWFVLGISLGIYMFYEYKKDKKFFNTLLEFNNSINDKSFEECLDIIGINKNTNIRDLLNNLLQSYTSDLEKIYSNNNVLS